MLSTGENHYPVNNCSGNQLRYPVGVGWGRVLLYMGYTGVCGCEGYGFKAVSSGIGYINQRVWPGSGIGMIFQDTDQLVKRFSLE